MMNTSQLFNLKEWLTVKDAAKHLSIFFEEKVSEADILRLALDGHLKLSVNFVNHASAILGKLIPSEEVEYLEYPAEVIFKNNLPPDMKGKTVYVPLEMQYDENRFLKFNETSIITIKGIWDLCMTGNEKNDVEHKYQMLTDGSEVTLICLDGTFVEREKEQICQIQERFQEKDLHQAEQNLIAAGAPITNSHSDKKNDPYNHPRNYYPAGGLPEDSTLVVRTQALIDFQDHLSSKTSVSKNNTSHLDHPFHAHELLIANEAWTELYENNPPPYTPPKGGHKKYITKWLKENYPKLGQRALDRISTVINPNPKGGASPIQDEQA